MSNEVAIFQDQNAGSMELAPEFRAMLEAGMTQDDLGAGVGGNYAILSIRGSKFRMKYQGNETPITDEKGDPIGSLEAVIVRANPYLTKQYYESGYSEGDSSAPVCFSIDGKIPSANAEKPQHTNCAMCPMNRFGSKITPAGVKVKACQDNKKVALAPLNDLPNTVFGGPMLFRIPASALKDLLTFNNKMTAQGYPYNSVAVRIGFDLEASYPKPTFRAIRPLTSEEAAVVVEHYQSDHVERLLGDFSELNAVPAADVEAAEEAFEQPPQPKPVVQLKPNPPVVKPAAKPAAIVTPIKPTVLVQPKPPHPAPVKKAPVTPAPPPAAKSKAAPAKPAPAPIVAQQPADDVIEGEATVVDDGGESALNDDIANILSELNATA
jgi:hypothetical protein